MRVSLHVVDESHLPPESAAGTTAGGLDAIESAIREHGGAWGALALPAQDYVRLFEILDRAVQGDGFLPELAMSGSPHGLLDAEPGMWRLGYFEASLVDELVGAFRILDEAIGEALGDESDEVRELYRLFREALGDADQRHLAVAIVHERSRRPPDGNIPGPTGPG